MKNVIQKIKQHIARVMFRQETKQIHGLINIYKQKINPNYGAAGSNVHRFNLSFTDGQYKDPVFTAGFQYLLNAVNIEVNPFMSIFCTQVICGDLSNYNVDDLNEIQRKCVEMDIEYGANALELKPMSNPKEHIRWINWVNANILILNTTGKLTVDNRSLS